MRDDFKKAVEVFFEGTADFLSWEDFWKLSDGKKATDYECQLSGFPYPESLGQHPERGELVKLKEPLEVWGGLHPCRALPVIEKSIRRLIDYYGPFVYGDSIILTYIGERKGKFTITFATGEVECIIQPFSKMDDVFGKVITFKTDKVSIKSCVITAGDLRFQGTPTGVILYDRHEKKSYRDNLKGMYHFYE